MLVVVVATPVLVILSFREAEFLILSMNSTGSRDIICGAGVFRAWELTIDRKQLETQL